MDGSKKGPISGRDIDILSIDLEAPGEDIPTLPPEIDNPLSNIGKASGKKRPGKALSGLVLLPTVDEIQAVKERVRADKGLSEELITAGVPLDGLYQIIAHYIREFDSFGAARKAKQTANKSMDNIKEEAAEALSKMEKYPHKKNRSRFAEPLGLLTALTIPFATKTFAQNAVGRIVKGPPLYPNLIRDLHRILTTNSETSTASSQPFRLMAGILSRLNLHAENFCQNRTDRNKKGDRLALLNPKGKGCSKFMADRGGCTLRNIFRCPWHEEARKAAAQAYKRASKKTRPKRT